MFCVRVEECTWTLSPLSSHKITSKKNYGDSNSLSKNRICLLGNVVVPVVVALLPHGCSQKRIHLSGHVFGAQVQTLHTVNPGQEALLVVRRDALKVPVLQRQTRRCYVFQIFPRWPVVHLDVPLEHPHRVLLVHVFVAGFFAAKDREGHQQVVEVFKLWLGLQFAVVDLKFRNETVRWLPREGALCVLWSCCFCEPICA